MSRIKEEYNFSSCRTLSLKHCIWGVASSSTGYFILSIISHIKQVVPIGDRVGPRRGHGGRKSDHLGRKSDDEEPNRGHEGPTRV